MDGRKNVSGGARLEAAPVGGQRRSGAHQRHSVDHSAGRRGRRTQPPHRQTGIFRLHFHAMDLPRWSNEAKWRLRWIFHAPVNRSRLGFKPVGRRWRNISWTFWNSLWMKRCWLLVKGKADVVAALSLEVLKGTSRAFDSDVHELRPHSGQVC